jgi:hypothetical protein
MRLLDYGMSSDLNKTPGFMLLRQSLLLFLAYGWGYPCVIGRYYPQQLPWFGLLNF